MNRRSLLKWLGGAAAATVIPASKVYSNKVGDFLPKRCARIAHITDIHLQHGKNAPDGLISCLHHIQQLDPLPDLILNGGDTINDALANTKSDVKSQWELWKSIAQKECVFPIEYCVGNHDVWGLFTAKSDPLYGKKFALEMLELSSTYRSFNSFGWHFIILDSTHQKKDGHWYTAELDEEQMEWLKNDLNNTPSTTPVLVLSHIPILSSTVFFDDAKVRAQKFIIPGNLMHTDVKEIIDLFNQHGNVKLCLSGHIHLADKVEYDNIAFYCNGAVCGDWWNSEYYRQTKAGYALIDLFEDGTSTNQYLHYR